MKSRGRRKKVPTNPKDENRSVLDQAVNVTDPDPAAFQARYSKLLLFRNLLMTLAASSLAISIDGLARGKDSYANQFFDDDSGEMVTTSSAMMMLVMMNLVYKIANLDLKKSATKGLNTDAHNAEVERSKTLAHQERQKAEEAEAAKRREADEWKKLVAKDKERSFKQERGLARERIAQIRAAVKASQESRGVSAIAESKQQGSTVSGYMSTVATGMYSLGSGIASAGYNFASKLFYNTDAKQEVLTEKKPRVKTNRRGRKKNYKLNAQNTDKALSQNIDSTFEEGLLLDQVAPLDTARQSPDSSGEEIRYPSSSEDGFYDPVDVPQSDHSIAPKQENVASEAVDVSAKPDNAFSQQSDNMLKQILAENAKLASELEAVKELVAKNLKTADSQPNAMEAEEGASAKVTKVEERGKKKKQKGKGAKAGKGGRDWGKIKKENEDLRAELDSLKSYLSSISSSSAIYYPHPAVVNPVGFCDSYETPFVNPDGSYSHRGVTYYPPFQFVETPEYLKRQGSDNTSFASRYEEGVGNAKPSSSIDLNDLESFPKLSSKSSRYK